MPNKIPLSVFIIAKNEADRIPAVIKSVIDWVDEVIVIDSGSEDNTEKVSQQLGAKVLYHEWKGYGPQKVYGQSECRNDWILNLDADEEVSPRLAQEIQALFNKQHTHKAYRFPIKIISRFQEKPGIFAPSNDPIRLYHKAYAGFKDSTVHDSVILYEKTSVGKFKGHVNHRCFRSYKHAVDKINFYTSMLAEDMVARGKKPNTLRILLEPAIAFLKAFILRRYLFLGLDGFVESIIYAFARTLRLAKAREAWKAKQSKEN